MEDILERDYNYNTPLELTEIFRMPNEEGILEERAAKFVIGWEDLRSIEQYIHPDNWINYKGEKYYIVLSFGQPKLIYGSYNEIKQYWTTMREKYPLFVTQERYGMD